MAKTVNRQIVERARVLVAGKETWTRFAVAKCTDGYRTTPWLPGAVKFCAVGALQRAAYEVTGDEQLALKVVPMIAADMTDPRKVAVSKLMFVNDFRGRQAVLRLFDRYLEGE